MSSITYYNHCHIAAHDKECHNEDGAEKEIEVAIVPLSNAVPNLQCLRNMCAGVGVARADT